MVTNLNCVNGSGLGLIHTFSANLDLSSFKYYFNPAAQVNLNTTRLYGALEIRISNNRNYNVASANLISDNNGVKTYVTDFYPIESLYRVVPTVSNFFQCSNMTERIEDYISVNLKLQVFYEFMPNRYGKTNRFWEVLTYQTQNNLVATPLVDLTASKFTSAPIVFYNSGGFQFTSNSNYKTRGTATNYDILTTSPGVSVDIVAGTQAVLASNSSIGSGISLKTQQFLNEYEDPQIYQVSASYVKNFCSQTGQYQSKNATLGAARLTQEGEIKEPAVNGENYSLMSYPNPAKDKVTFRYYLEQPTHVLLNLISTTGSVIATPVDAYQEVGPYEISYDVFTLPGGIYLYTLETNKGKQTKRLAIVR
ncbi:MAG: T9SS type A sorting domain-containing protein [Cyclobacteriaceae bacterium]|nr:T9SS type A sorting domain-containing protein [Chitinophagaceae bacterium]MBY0433278.1 T9SS type A sorting domain-containing protein [Cyclobacteriaceae bacterium]